MNAILDPRRLAQTAGEVVYYLRRTSDGAYKIGTTRRLPARMKELARQHGEIELLAIEPGGFLLETNRNREFWCHQFSSEWFMASCRELREHIETLAGGAR